MTRRQLLMALGVAALAEAARAAGPAVARWPGTPSALRCNGRVELECEGGVRWAPCAMHVPPPTDVRVAVVVLHSLNVHLDALPRAAGAYRDLFVGLADRAGIAASTLVAAPLFLEEQDLGHAPFESSALCWRRSGWSWGQDSSASCGATISSFAVVDAILGWLLEGEVAPRLESVLLAGHSAGGQFVNRYAAVNALHARFAAAGIGVRYACSAPSSYLYLGPERPTAGAAGGFAVPSPAPAGYNDYGYGLEGLSTCRYVEAVGEETILAQYPLREVTYLCGERDATVDEFTDTSAGALTQGASRLERCLAYGRHLEARFGAALAGRHRVRIAPGATHSGRQVFSSEEGMAALFGR